MLTILLTAAVVGGVIASPYLLTNFLTKKTDELIVQINAAVGENPANRPLARLFDEVQEKNQQSRIALKNRRPILALQLATEASESAVGIIKYLGI